MLECPKCVSNNIKPSRINAENGYCTNCGYADRRFVFEVVEEPTAEDRAFDAMAERLHDAIPHPLLNPESKHYSMVDGTEAIEHMEMMFSTVELMHWAKLTAMKYRLRIGNKDDVLKEAEKIKTYEDYYKYLEAKLQK